MNSNYDVMVIGSGPAGYVCAIRCSQLGLKTALVEKTSDEKGRPVFGGTCLNVGCIPSKALLDSSYRYAQANENFSSHGILVNNLALDISKMMERKQKIVSQLTSGISGLLKHNDVTVIQGRGKLLAKRKVEVRYNDKVETYDSANIVLASGSEPIEISSVPIDREHVVDSTGALCFKEVPKRLGISVRV